MKTIFITGHRKSGTTLLSNLFDGHEDFAVYPTDLSLMYAYFPYFNKSSISHKQKIKRIKKILKLSLEKNLNYRVKRENVSIYKFINCVLKKINNKNINNIKAIIKILREEFIKFYKLDSKKFFVIKETSADIYFNKFFRKKDEIKFIHIIRDPRDNYASLKSGQKSYYSKIGEDNLILLSSLVNRAKLDYQFLKFNSKIYGSGNYYTVKYEDLVTNPQRAMKKICKFLKVKFNKKMLTPTIFESKIKSNTFTKSNVTFINTRSKNRWIKELNNFEKSVINHFFKSELKKYYNTNSIKINYAHISDYYSWMNRKLFFNDSFR